MEKLKTILLTEGMHGMISQVEGMAKALNTEFDHKIVRLSFPWNLVPPKLTPISEIILKDKIYLIKNEIPEERVLFHLFYLKEKIKKYFQFIYKIQK